MGVKIKVDLSTLADKWPSAIVSRDSIGEFTGGVISSKRLANLDSLGEGPEGAIRCGRKVAYPVKNLILWLEKRSRKRIVSKGMYSQENTT